MGTRNPAELDYSGEALPAQNDALRELDELLDRAAEARLELARAKRAVEEAEKQRKWIEETLLPDHVKSMGLVEGTTIAGRHFKLDEKVYASLPVEDRDRLDRGCAWLEEHGHGGVIKSKLTASLGKGETELAEQAAGTLRALGVDADLRKEVNHQTLSKLVRELLAQGRDVPRELLGVYDKAVVRVRTK